VESTIQRAFEMRAPEVTPAPTFVFGPAACQSATSRRIGVFVFGRERDGRAREATGKNDNYGSALAA
jgi:hypothetical protein